MVIQETKRMCRIRKKLNKLEHHQNKLMSKYNKLREKENSKATKKMTITLLYNELEAKCYIPSNPIVEKTINLFTYEIKLKPVFQLLFALIIFFLLLYIIYIQFKFILCMVIYSIYFHQFLGYLLVLTISISYLRSLLSYFLKYECNDN